MLLSGLIKADKIGTNRAIPIVSAIDTMIINIMARLDQFFNFSDKNDFSFNILSIEKICVKDF